MRAPAVFLMLSAACFASTSAQAQPQQPSWQQQQPPPDGYQQPPPDGYQQPPAQQGWGQATPVYAPPQGQDQQAFGQASEYPADPEAGVEGEGLPPATPEGPKALEARVMFGLGLGMRELLYPVMGVTNSVDLSAFVASDIGAHIALRAADGVWLGALFGYQTSIGHIVDERHVASAGVAVGVRAHRFEGAFVPEVRLGDEQELRISLALGYTSRNLRPEVHHLLTPSYSLSGPVVRPMLRIPVISKRLALRIAPELIVVVDVGQALREKDIDSSGLGLGGEAQLELKLSDYFAVMLTFRESHIALGTQAEGAQGESATDVERFITARVVGTL